MRLIVARVMGFAGPPDGFEADVSYRMAYMEPGGGVVVLENQRTSCWTWPSNVRIDPGRLVNKLVLGYLDEDGEIAWVFVSPPLVGECTPPDAVQRPPLMPTEGLGPVSLPPPQIPPGGGEGPASLPVGGGEI